MSAVMNFAASAITEALRQRGHEVHVLTSNHGVQTPPAVAESYIDRSLLIHGYYGHPWLGLNALKHLFLDCPNVTDEGVQQLERALPNCKIER